MEDVSAAIVLLRPEGAGPGVALLQMEQPKGWRPRGAQVPYRRPRNTSYCCDKPTAQKSLPSEGISEGEASLYSSSSQGALSSP